MSTSFTEEQAPPADAEPVITTLTGRFEIVHQDDNTQTIKNIPRVPDKNLTAPIQPHNVQDIWSEDDDEDMTAINTGMSTATVKAQIHTDVTTNVETINDNDTDDKDDEDVKYFRQLMEWCETVNTLIATKGFCSCHNKMHELIPELYSAGFDITNFPYLADYYKQVIGPLPNQKFLRNALDGVFNRYPHLQPIQEYVYATLRYFL